MFTERTSLVWRLYRPYAGRNFGCDVGNAIQTQPYRSRRFETGETSARSTINSFLPPFGVLPAPSFCAIPLVFTTPTLWVIHKADHPIRLMTAAHRPLIFFSLISRFFSALIFLGCMKAGSFGSCGTSSPCTKKKISHGSFCNAIWCICYQLKIIKNALVSWTIEVHSRYFFEAKYKFSICNYYS